MEKTKIFQMPDKAKRPFELIHELFASAKLEAMIEHARNIARQDFFEAPIPAPFLKLHVKRRKEYNTSGYIHRVSIIRKQLSDDDKY